MWAVHLYAYCRCGVGSDRCLTGGFGATQLVGRIPTVMEATGRQDGQKRRPWPCPQSPYSAHTGRAVIPTCLQRRLLRAALSSTRMYSGRYIISSLALLPPHRQTDPPGELDPPERLLPGTGRVWAVVPGMMSSPPPGNKACNRIVPVFWTRQQTGNGTGRS